MGEVKFGSAGLGPVATAEKVLESYHKLGLKCCEIAFTYSVYIKPEDAVRIGKKAKELEIELSIHAPYFVNLNSDDPKKIKATKERILNCCEIGELLGAKIVVFHPGYYGNKVAKSSKDKLSSDYGKGDRILAYTAVKEGILDLLATIKKKGWKIKIGPETMGKINVFGSIDEISRLAKETGCSFCIDFAHILARDKKVNYDEIKKLFPQKEWHCHFSGIVYGDKGEKNHKKTTKEEWLGVLRNLPKDKDVRIINESPDMVQDAVDGMKLLGKLK